MDTTHGHGQEGDYDEAKDMDTKKFDLVAIVKACNRNETEYISDDKCNSLQKPSIKININLQAALHVEEQLLLWDSNRSIPWIKP